MGTFETSDNLLVSWPESIFYYRGHKIEFNKYPIIKRPLNRLGSG